MILKRAEMNQLKLPGLEEEEFLNPAHGQSQWVPSDRIMLGQPFILWGKPEHPDNPEEVRKAIDRVFQTSQQIQHVLPWCMFNYQSDPKTGMPIIVGVPYSSGVEMVGALVLNGLAGITVNLASAFTVLNWSSSTFQMSSLVHESRNRNKDETLPESPQP